MDILQNLWNLEVTFLLFHFIFTLIRYIAAVHGRAELYKSENYHHHHMSLYNTELYYTILPHSRAEQSCIALPLPSDTLCDDSYLGIKEIFRKRNQIMNKFSYNSNAI